MEGQSSGFAGAVPMAYSGQRKVRYLVQKHGLDDPKNRLSECFEWNYLYQNCAVGHGLGHES